MNDKSEASPENICKGIIDALGEELSWKWDDRFEAALAEFQIKSRDPIHEILSQHFNIIWDTSNIGSAPDHVLTINRNLGGIRSGQLLFTTEPNVEGILFCAWWPWGNGTTISIRIAQFINGDDETAYAGQMDLFRSWFGV